MPNKNLVSLYKYFLLHSPALINPAVFVFIFIALSLFGGSQKIRIIEEAQAQVTHPFLIVNESEYTELRNRANSSPWSSMKSAAIYDVTNTTYSTSDTTLIKLKKMRIITSAGALAYILDPTYKTTYKNKVRDTLLKWDDLITSINNDPSFTSWYSYSYAQSAFFNSVLALDIIYNDLTSTERSSIETKLAVRANYWWTTSGFELARWACAGTWALYKNDTTRINTCITNYITEMKKDTSAGGVYGGGPYYAHARIAGSDTYLSEEDAQALFMDVLAHTGKATIYTDSVLRNLTEWTAGYTVTPFKTAYYIFGDTHAEGNMLKDGAAVFSAKEFSDTAAKNAAWVYEGAKPGRLLHYVLLKTALPAAVKPTSRIFDEGAWFLENNPATTSLAGALWSAKASFFHSHRETNSIYVAAYGTHVLRNVGYISADLGALGYTTTYIHDTAVASNTVLINGTNHQTEIGGGIVEGFTSNFFDYATGVSGTALPNGKHRRNFAFIHPQDGKNGYWLLYDEVTANIAGNSVNVALHPNSDISPLVVGREYTFDIKNNTNLHLTIYLGTPPSSVSINNGLLANYRNSFEGKYLYSTYYTDGAGKKNIVTVLFPHDATHAKAAMNSISGGYTGANIDLGGSIIDTALESSGSSVLTYNGVSFQGTAVWYRKRSGINAGYFVRQGKTFSDGYYGFESTAAVTLHLKDKSGKITSPGASVRFFYPGISSVYIDGIQVTPTSSNTNISMTVYVSAGTHAISFISGGTAAVTTPTFSPPTGTYTNAQNVTISTSTTGATIYYTLDGSDPATSTTRTIYSSAISVSSTKTIKAKAFKTGMTPSVTSSATYTINTSGTTNPVNLVQNPSFETGSASPWTFYNNGTGTSTVVSPGYSGSYTAKMSITTVGTNVQLYQHNISIEPNTNYRLTFSAYSNTGHDMTVKLLKNSSPYNNYGLSYTANLTTSWQTFTTEFTSTGLTATDADSLLQFYLASYIAAGDVYYIDNVILEKVTTTTPPLPATPVNLLDNPSFETGSASPWLFYNNGTGSSAIVSPGYSGSYTAKISITTVGTNIQLYQHNITIEPNTKYRLTFSAYSNTGHDLTVKLLKNSSPYTNYGLSYTANLTASWQTFTTEFNSSGLTATDADSLLQFYLASYIAAGDVYYIDNVKLEKI